MQSQLSLFWVLLWQNFGARDRHDRFKLFWTFTEPIGQMAVLMLIFSLIGRTAAYGRSFALFLIAGLTILSIFTRSSQAARAAILGLSKQSRLAQVGMFHEAVARVFFVGAINAVSMAMVLFGVGLFSRVETIPHHWQHVVAAFLWTMLMGFGIGLLRAYWNYFVPVAERIYLICSRGLIFLSGVFYMPSYLPPVLREPLSWNPILHGVELLRLGIYREYPTTVYDPLYFKAVALGATVSGMALLWNRRAMVMG